MTVRAKFKLIEVALLAYSQTAQRLKFSAEYDTSIPEDQRFQQATPWGQFETLVDNPAALEQLKLGETYYLDLTPCNPPAPAAAPAPAADPAPQVDPAIATDPAPAADAAAEQETPAAVEQPAEVAPQQTEGL